MRTATYANREATSRSSSVAGHVARQQCSIHWAESHAQLYPGLGHDFSRVQIYDATHGLGVAGSGSIAALEPEAVAPSGAEPATEEARPSAETSGEATEAEGERREAVETARAMVAEPEPSVIEPVRIVRDKDLWWFDGEDAANYAEEAKLTAFGATPGATRGQFVWDVVRGTDKVDFQNDSDSMTRTNANRITVKSTAASASRGDVRVRCRWSLGGASATLYHDFTVYAPSAGVAVSGPNDFPFNGGFRSEYVIEVRDQFNRRLPADVEINESWGTFTADQPVVNNWFIAPPNGAMTGPPNNGPGTAQFYENYGMPAGPSLVPPAVNPGAPGSANPVMHATQYYRAGSTAVGAGRLIKTHTTQYCQGRGRQ